MFTPAAAVRRPHPRHAGIGMPVLLRQRQWWVLLCLLALLGFQSLGLVHRSLHGGGVGPRVALAINAIHGNGGSASSGLTAGSGLPAGAGLNDGAGLPAGTGLTPGTAVDARSLVTADRGLTANADRPASADALPSAERVPSADSFAAFKVPSLGHLPGSTDCQLLDELSTALGPITQALAWTALLPDHPVATAVPLSAPVVQTWRAPARAPPLA